MMYKLYNFIFLFVLYFNFYCIYNILFVYFDCINMGFKESYLHGLKIASLNIDGLYSKLEKRKNLNKWMINNNIDILCIQEWYKLHNDKNIQFPKNEFPDYNIFTNNTLSTAIIYKNTLNIMNHNISNNNNSLLSRSWISVFSNKSILNIGNVYYSPNSEVNNINILTNDMNHIKNVNKKFKNYFLINGDFNTHSHIWDDSNNIEEDNKSEMIETWLIDNNCITLNNGMPTHYNRSTKKESAIDLSIVSKNTTSLVSQWYVSMESRGEEYIHNIISNNNNNNKSKSKKSKKINNSNDNYKYTFMSDHYFLVTWINFRANNRQLINRTIIDFNSGNHEEYNKLLKQLLPLWEEYYNKYKNNKSKLNDITLLLQTIIKYAGARAYGVKYFTKRDVYWINESAMNAINMKKKIKRKYYKLKHKNTDKARKMRDKINKCNQIIHKIKIAAINKYQAYLQHEIQDLCEKDNKLFYRLANKAMNINKSGICPLKNKNGEIIAITAKEKAEVLHKHFNEKVSENDYLPKHKLWHEFIETTVNDEFINDNNINENDSKRCDILNRKITEQEIIKAIQSSKLDTACGYDNISIKLIHYARFVLAYYLQLLYNLIFLQWHIFPICWVLINMLGIPKPGRDNSIPKNNRPISLQCTLPKTFTKVMAHRLLSFLIINDLLEIWNCGFQKNKSPEDIMLSIDENVKYAFEFDSFIEVAFMDIQSAYDTVWHKGLIFKLKIIFGIVGNFLTWIYNYMLFRFNRVILDGHKTEFKLANLGIMQGCTMSPIIWAVDINDYGSNINNKEMANKYYEFCIKKLNHINKTLQYIDNETITENTEYTRLNDLKIELINLIDKKENILNIYNDNNYNNDNNNNNNNISSIKSKLVALADDLSLFVPNKKASSVNCELLQKAIDNVYDWTLYWRFTISIKKCNTITLTRKKNYKSRVYNVNNVNLDCVHFPSNAPETCMHNKECKKYFESIINTHNNNSNNSINTNLLNFDNNGDSILNDDNLFIPSKWAMNNKKCLFDNLPLTVRILGLFFDPKLNWSEQVKIVKKKCKKKLYKLARIAYHKDFNLSPNAVWKLYLTTIRPVIEYGFIIYSSAPNFKELEDIQYKAARIALRQRKTVPREYLDATFNIVSLQNRLELAMNKFWNHLIRAPNNLIKNEIFKEWYENSKHLINNNNNNNNNTLSLRNRVININPLNTKTKHIKNTTISRCYLLMNDLSKISKNIIDIKMDYHKQVFKAPPTYAIPYPLNISIYANISDYNKNILYKNKIFKTKKKRNKNYINNNNNNTQNSSQSSYNAGSQTISQLPDFNNNNDNNENKIIEKDNTLLFFTDGSTMPNPGPGGCAVLCPKLPIFDKKVSINHNTTINYCETVVLIYLLKKCIECNHILVTNNINILAIFTDSRFLLNALRISGYAHLQYYHNLILQIFELCHKLKSLAISIKIIKIKAHSNNEFNDKVDSMAKDACHRAVIWKNTNNNNWHDEYTPAIVSISYFNEIISKKFDKINYIKWKKRGKIIKHRINDRKTDESIIYYDYLFYNAMWQYGYFHKLNNNNKLLKSELSELNTMYAEIIFKLRTETAYLNNYRHYIYKDCLITCPNIGCNVRETVAHYLIDCPKFDIIRNDLRKKLIKTCRFFKYNYNFTAINILFPHHWQIEPSGRDKDYKSKIKQNKNIRVEIIKAVVQYVKDSKRFDDTEYGI